MSLALSIIIPVYNCEKTIRKCLDSIFIQKNDLKYEIIIVDDGSSDGTVEVVESVIAGRGNVKFIHQENAGAGAARNKALELATGQYVAFLDSDDLWLPEKTARQLALMKDKKSPFSYAAIEMMDESGKTIKKKRNIKETCDYRYLLHNTVIATSSVIIDRNELGDFRMPLRRGGQDYATWLKLLRGGVVACGINEVLVRYRVGSNSLSSNKFKSVKQVWEIQTQDEIE